MTLQEETPCWYALEVKRRFEKHAASTLAAKGLEQYLPTYTPKHMWNGRAARARLALFPGYLFCRFPERRRLEVLTTPGVYRIVSFSNKLSRVPEEEIEGIRTLLASGVAVERCDYTEIGDRVRLQAGPLNGLEGIVVGYRNNARLIVSVTILRRSVAAEIDPQWIGPPIRSELPGESREGQGGAFKEGLIV